MEQDVQHGEAPTPSNDTPQHGSAVAANATLICPIPRLDAALRWASENFGHLPPRLVSIKNRVKQADIDAVDEHFRQKKFKRRLQHQRRRARLKSVPGMFTLEDWREIVMRHGHRCAYCGEFRKRLTIDHVMPISKGGAHSKENIVPACKRCNSSKKDRLWAVPPVNFSDPAEGVRS